MSKQTKKYYSNCCGVEAEPHAFDLTGYCPECRMGCSFVQDDDEYISMRGIKSISNRISSKLDDIPPVVISEPSGDDWLKRLFINVGNDIKVNNKPMKNNFSFPEDFKLPKSYVRRMELKNKIATLSKSSDEYWDCRCELAVLEVVETVKFKILQYKIESDWRMEYLKLFRDRKPIRQETIDAVMSAFQDFADGKLTYTKTNPYYVGIDPISENNKPSIFMRWGNIYKNLMRK